jgi:hypothetical protein
MIEKIKQTRVSITVSGETKIKLDSIRRLGQSYNGLIQELVVFWNKENGQENKNEETFSAPC